MDRLFALGSTTGQANENSKAAEKIFERALASASVYFISQGVLVLFADLIFFKYVPFYQLTLWNFFHLGNMLARYMLIRQYKRVAQTRKSKTRKYTDLYFYSLMLTGLLWAVMVYFLKYIPEKYYFTIYGLIVMMTFASTTSIGSIKPFFLSFIFPMNAAMFAVLLFHPDIIFNIAAFALLFSVFFSFKSAGIHIRDYQYVLDNEAKARKLKEHFKELAGLDVLTGLPNRSRFFELFDESITNAEKKGEKLALMFLDLDNFKDINDTYGHHAGDAVLQHTGKILMESAAKNDIPARLAGDEFVMVIMDIDSRSDADSKAETIGSRIAKEVEIDGIAADISAAIGTAIYPEDGTNMKDLIKYADAKMYERKRETKSRLYQDSVRQKRDR